MPSISVIVPAYNAARTIERTLQSIADQTHAPDEVVIVDDGSTDDTAAIVRAWAARDSRLTLIQQANQGPVAARNLAIAHSRGDLIAPLDADDLWRPEYLARMAAALEPDAGAGFVYCLYRWIDGDDRVLHDGGDYGCEGRVLLRHLLVNFVGNGSCAVFRREALLSAGGFDPDAEIWGGAEDYLLQMRIAARAPVARVGAHLVGYRRSVTSYSAKAPARNYIAQVSAVERVMAEQGLHEPTVRRWVRSNALRTAAVKFALAGRWAGTLSYGARAMTADPEGTLIELSARLRNAVGRAAQPARADPGQDFMTVDPVVRIGPPADPLTLRRLAALEAREVTPSAV